MLRAIKERCERVIVRIVVVIIQFRQDGQRINQLPGRQLGHQSGQDVAASYQPDDVP